VFTSEGIDRRFYETCVLSELGKSLRAGDLSVASSRRYRDFEDYLLPAPAFAAMHTAGLPLAVEIDAKKYLAQRADLLNAEFLRVDRLAQAKELPDASVIDGVLKITPLDNQESDEAELLTRQAYGLMPRIKITDLLTEVDGWCDFGRHFTNLRSGDAVPDRALLLTAILADGINLGLTRMADACPGISLSTLSRIATWHIRDETYAKALAEIVNHHHGLEFAAHWGDGTTSSSDGQRFKAGGVGEATGSVNARYGNEPGATFYTHISDQYAPFHIKLISATVRDATHVLDGLLYHESDLRIEEHYTDTAGFTPCVRPDAPAWLPVRAAHPQPCRHASLCRGEAVQLCHACSTCRRYSEHEADRCPLERNPPACHVNQTWLGNGIPDAAQARGIPASERPGCSLAGTRQDRTDAVPAAIHQQRRTAAAHSRRTE
jgi:hypothetical protein